MKPWQSFPPVPLSATPTLRRMSLATRPVAPITTRNGGRVVGVALAVPTPHGRPCCGYHVCACARTVGTAPPLSAIQAPKAADGWTRRAIICTKCHKADNGGWYYDRFVDNGRCDACYRAEHREPAFVWEAEDKYRRRLCRGVVMWPASGGLWHWHRGEGHANDDAASEVETRRRAEAYLIAQGVTP